MQEAMPATCRDKRASLTQCEHRHLFPIVQLDCGLLFVRRAPAHALQFLRADTSPLGL